jgi:FkbM family methyltransferase
LNLFRNFFRIQPFEKILVSLTCGRPARHFFSKFVPNPYQYPVNSLRVIERKGIKMRLDISDYIGHYIYFGFEDPSFESLMQLCTDGANVLDVGANVGWTVLNIAKRIQTGMVLGFEPDPFNYQRCMENVSLNDPRNVLLFPVGLSDIKATLNMEVRVASNRGGNRILSSGAGHQVEVVKLDDFEPIKNLGHVDLIKIDVEGYEMNVLKGARGLLEKHHPVLFIEVDDSNLRDQGYSARELIVFLNDNAYHNLVSSDDGRSITSTDDFTKCHFDIVAR